MWYIKIWIFGIVFGLIIADFVIKQEKSRTTLLQSLALIIIDRLKLPIFLHCCYWKSCSCITSYGMISILCFLSSFLGYYLRSFFFCMCFGDNWGLDFISSPRWMHVVYIGDIFALIRCSMICHLIVV